MMRNSHGYAHEEIFMHRRKIEMKSGYLRWNNNSASRN